MGAGFLPVSICNGKLMFLFGEERQRPKESARGWADFGGGPEKGETNIDTAAREGSEELTGLLGNRTKIRKLLNSKKKVTIKVKDIVYTAYVVPVDYSPDIVKHFNNQAEFFKKYVPTKVLHNSVIYEKSSIKWFSIEDMKKERSKFRNFYQHIVDEIIENEDKIMKLFTSSKKKTRKNRGGGDDNVFDF